RFRLVPDFANVMLAVRAFGVNGSHRITATVGDRELAGFHIDGDVTIPIVGFDLRSKRRVALCTLSAHLFKRQTPCNGKINHVASSLAGKHYTTGEAM